MKTCSSLRSGSRQNGFRADQVQAFLPSPMASATAMYYSGKNPLRRVTRDSENVAVAKGLRQRRLHKAFLRYHDPNNWPVLREALRRMGRGNLIGSGPNHLIPAYQPRGTGLAAEGQSQGTPHAHAAHGTAACAIASAARKAWRETRSKPIGRSGGESGGTSKGRR